jgi:uncharacterized protein (DUF362 family)
MERRKFVKTGLLAAAGLSSIGYISFSDDSKSVVANALDNQIFDSKKNMNTMRVKNALDRAMQRLFKTDSALQAWKKVVKPGEVIGLKVNCLSGRGSTHTALVDVIIESLQQAGIKAGHILIWDRMNNDLEDAGFKINMDKNKTLCFGNDYSGFEYNLEEFGLSGSRLTKIVTKICDGIINLPVLRDHSIAGMTLALKNMFGAIHNPNKYHLNTGNPYIADINAFSHLRKKIRLHICDALEAQYHGGPSFMPQWRWTYSGLLISRDPVALDYTGWQIIEQKRLEKGFKSLKTENREPVYINTAADREHQLGVCNPDLIEVINV